MSMRLTCMKHSCAALAVALGVLGAAPALAGPFGDDLAKCLVRSTSEADKRLLVKWIFGTVVLHPEVAAMAKVDDAVRAELVRGTARLFERLLTESCRNEAQLAVKNEGSSAIASGFQVLGQVAARELFSNPKVAESMRELGDQLDKKKLSDAFGSALTQK